MTQSIDHPAGRLVRPIETPSGKDRHGENFPVGSLLIRPDLRRHVHVFYRFARQADDIADNAGLAPAEKLRRLDLMGAMIEGQPSAGSPAAAAMRRSLEETGIGPAHCLDLLVAFKRDATKQRYQDWAELIDYCRYSAMPVGRHVLDLHGESAFTHPPSDALCAALQVLNHLQDCADDLRHFDRCYLPGDLLAAEAARVEDLRRPELTPGLRRVLDAMLERTDDLIAQSRSLPARVRDPRLRAEVAIIIRLAERLLRRLQDGDPLARRIKLSAFDFAGSTLGGLMAGLIGPRPAPQAQPAR